MSHRYVRKCACIPTRRRSVRTHAHTSTQARKYNTCMHHTNISDSDMIFLMRSYHRYVRICFCIPTRRRSVRTHAHTSTQARTCITRPMTEYVFAYQHAYAAHAHSSQQRPQKHAHSPVHTTIRTQNAHEHLPAHTHTITRAHTFTHANRLANFTHIHTRKHSHTSFALMPTTQ